jgi:enediyne biosynthesis protein E3
MNLQINSSAKMEYIQHVFLSVQDYMQKDHELEEVISFLDSEPPEFRSVAYESASMEIGMRELSDGKELNNWKLFYQRAANVHTFHMEIGLGWAFAKSEIPLDLYLKSLEPVMNWMIFDGIGYYHGLFKGRRTVKSQLLPEGFGEQELSGFDQGLGRRLWYIAKGDVQETADLIKSFQVTRHFDLWRGVGIACGYVGGTRKSDMELLLDLSGTYKKQLQTGIALAAMSRKASDSVSEDIEQACEIICGMPLMDVLILETGLSEQFYSKSGIIS